MVKRLLMSALFKQPIERTINQFISKEFFERKEKGEKLINEIQFVYFKIMVEREEEEVEEDRERILCVYTIYKYIYKAIIVKF